jgi:hypothetical protein
MSGSMTLNYEAGEFSILMYDDQKRMVDRYDVDHDKFTLTRDAAIAISDDVLAHLNAN